MKKQSGSKVGLGLLFIFIGLSALFLGRSENFKRPESQANRQPEALHTRLPAQNVDETNQALISDILNLSNDTLDSTPESQALFYTHIESDAIRFYDTHRLEMGKVDRGLWTKTVKSMVAKMKSFKLGLKAVARFGRPASRVFQVSFVISNFLPIPLYALGLNSLATMVLLVPWELIIPPLYMIGTGALRIALNYHRFGIGDYARSLELRRQLLGMSDRQRLTTILDEELMREIDSSPNNRWISISRTTLGERGILGQSLSLEELEAIVRSIPDGSDFIDDFSHDRVSKDLYAMELWHAIRSDDEAKGKLKLLLKERLPNTQSPAVVKLARQLSTARDLEKALIEKEEELINLINQARKRSLPLEEKSALKEIVIAAKNTSVAIFQAIHDIESYSLVARIKNEEVAYNFEKALLEAQNLYSSYHKASEEMKLFDQDRLINAQRIKKVLGLNEMLKQRESFAFKYRCAEALGLFMKL